MATSEVRYDRALVWFRRDLRDFDHAALYHALRSANAVYCVFVFDREILDRLNSPADRRVEFIWESAAELRTALEKRGGALIVAHASAREEIPRLATRLHAQAVFANHDYDPGACDRDAAVAEALSRLSIAFHTSKDQVIFERDEVLTQAGKPFSVFTPYKNAWLTRLTPFHLKSYPVARHESAFARPPQAVVRRASFARGAGIRANQPGRSRDRPGDDRRHSSVFAVSRADRPLPRGARLSGGRRTLISFGAPSLRHGIDPRARRVRACAFAGTRRRWCRNLAFGTDLAGFLRANPLASSARRRREFQARIREPCAFRAIPPGLQRGAPAPPATRSSMRRCASSTPPATCTTGCG